MQGRCGGVHWLTSNGDVPLVRNTTPLCYRSSLTNSFVC
ncbi:hypothetical protein VD0002_g9914 [Verticillium dahliae]|uniref:Uncharacterized protein n=1 Tax=Verticillium dahliae TaxID=27337 RepID=A0AA44WQN7_VERDA|nr:hypothetical protein BJF96_g1629 [Verticillium dahliae]PNH42247.1 hypothetical protein VD0003_g9834 [Verticillium dahliae]PNH55236.1 hypothetical protein VD0002_g9914 [Verticillium dahliae]